MGNLPNFPGASVVYTRAALVLEHINATAYARQKAAAKGRKFRFAPNSDADLLVRAMNEGDEELLKSMNNQFRHIIFPGSTQ